MFLSLGQVTNNEPKTLENWVKSKVANIFLSVNMSRYIETPTRICLQK